MMGRMWILDLTYIVFESGISIMAEGLVLGRKTLEWRTGL